MEELLGTLGINWKLFLGQIVNFLIFLYVVNRFVFRPLFAVLKKREETIEKGLHDAKENTKARSKMELEREQILLKAREEAEKIVEASVYKAKEARTKVLEEARQEVKQIFESSNAEIEGSRSVMYQELTTQVGDLAVQLAEKIVRHEIDKKKNDALVKELLKEIQNS